MAGRSAVRSFDVLLSFSLSLSRVAVDLFAGCSATAGAPTTSVAVSEDRSSATTEIEDEIRRKKKKRAGRSSRDAFSTLAKESQDATGCAMAATVAAAAAAACQTAGSLF